MTSYRRLWFAVLAALMLSVLFCMPASAQGPADVTAATPATTSDSDASAGAKDPTDVAVQNQATSTPAPDPAPQKPATGDDPWKFAFSIYGWFPGIHGTVGVLGHDAGVHAPFSDVFHYLKGVIPIAVEADKGRFVMPFDFFWVKLGDDRGIPLNDFGQTSINLHVTESIFTPKFGYRIVDKEHFKVDALAGIRYWHVGQNLSLEPSGVGFSQSANWVDGLGGARFTLPLAEKAAIIIAGDAGGGGANLDYQVVGLFTYKFTPKLGLGLGWRYLDVNYGGSHQFLYDVAQTGAVAGMFLELGGKPPVPVSASCSISPTEIWAGTPVAATISTQNFNPKHTISYKWSTSGGKISGTSTTGNVDTAGLAPGSYTVTGTATDEKEKKNNVATCNASFTVRQPRPPEVSCSANPTTVQAGTPSTVTASGSSPDPGVTISSYAYQASAGTISGTGTTATLDSTGAPAGPINVTVTATDSRGLTGTCTTTVTVEAPPPAPQVSARTPIQFIERPKQKYIPWRVDNEAKAILDDDASALKNDPNAKLVIVGYADGEPQPEIGTGKNRHPMDLAAQRAVNTKAYLVQQQGIDPSRIEVRKGTGKDHVADIFWVPQGADTATASVLQGTTPVDESVVTPSENAYPKPKTAAPVHHHHAAKSAPAAGSTAQ